MHLKLRIRFLITILLVLSISIAFIWRLQKLKYTDLPGIWTFKRKSDKFKPTLIKSVGYQCDSHNISVFRTQINIYTKVRHQSNSCIDCKSSIVVFTLSKSSPTSRYLVHIIKVLLIPHHVISMNHAQLSKISDLLNSISQEERIRIIIFENFAIYTNLPPLQKLQLDTLCKKYNIGVVGFLLDGEGFTTEGGTWSKIGELPLYIHRLRKPPQGFYTSLNASILRATRSGRMNSNTLEIEKQIHGAGNQLQTQTVCCMATLVPFTNNKQFYNTIAFTKTGEYSGRMQTYDSLPVDMKSCANYSTESHSGTFPVYQSLVLEDVGLFDGIQRVLFAFRPGGIWLSSILLLDTIVYLSKASNELDLLRWVLVDIDDVFVPDRDAHLSIDDINAMIKAQNYWRTFIQEFTFNMGFCGAFFSKSRWSDKIVYNYILQNRHKFWWFSHLWHHGRPHMMNKTCIQQAIERNQVFAEERDIPVQIGYSVAPRHSGVYPVYPDLYEAWRTVSNVNVTSTIHYPYVRSSDFHSGFRYNNIQVLPRQTCGIYTHTPHPEDIRGGMKQLIEYIFGGELFHTFLFNPVSIFMTHLVNYGNDRLALYLFNAIFEFMTNWTNIKLITSPPSELANIYSERFKLYGVNELPLYSDPCRNSHLHELWPSDWPCGSNHLPSFIIIGPQKTGSTALLHFLLLNPELMSNRFQHDSTFEELQFFSSDDIYSRGVHWYMNQFPNNSIISPTHAYDFDNNRSNYLKSYAAEQIRFEKSATYFDNPKSPARIQALMPEVKLIVLLRNPIERAYSWYQHRLAHRDIAPQLLSFVDLMRLMQQLVSSINHLWSRCIGPGNYEQYLRNWLTYFPASQLLLLDADRFSRNPVPIMKIVQQFILVHRQLDYSQYLHFNRKKGFFCVTTRNAFSWNNGCLGRSKGRTYEPLDRNTLLPNLMELYFSEANHKLYRLLQKYPLWSSTLTLNTHKLPSWIKMSD
ncbi:putative heparan sulfate n-deacetylase/n-sulfotransferase [Schistosoma mansoni]|uniref:putative heparan sulfate n-deacetylase/n-sulfotransferase n=1 Tax=Schistosoma mansoni TaxID=6183 RepID=UPI0001A64174|nr:putative heparan sulfate n-deacetylase/n-sulfotransferase [Schistosoma mansoni]|eukprot:XP_018649753.1 putative heparan sulfate n-deacetylase/n-sulfotransferase [Schistosoma mansoni]